MSRWFIYLDMSSAPYKWQLTPEHGYISFEITQEQHSALVSFCEDVAANKSTGKHIEINVSPFTLEIHSAPEAS